MKKICLLLMSLAWVPAMTAQDVSDHSASLAGRVLDASGNSYPAQVRIFRQRIREGFASLERMCGTRTGQQGEFQCADLEEGKYIVQVFSLRTSSKEETSKEPSKATSKTTEALAETTPVLIFYPGVTDLTRAILISLRSKEAGWADIRVEDAPTVEVTGTLMGHPQNAHIRLEAESADGLTLDTNVECQYDSSTGRFAFSNVPAGHYRLRANWLGGWQEQHPPLPLGSYATPENPSGSSSTSEGSRTSLRSATVRLQVDAVPVDHLLIEAAPLVEISGQLPELTSGVTVLGVQLQSTDGTTHDRRATVRNGSFTFHSVPAGEYNLSLLSGEQAYVSSVSVGGKDVGSSRFSVEESQDKLNLEPEIKSPCVSVQGSVREWDGPAQTAEVIAQSEDSGEVYKVKTDKERKFSFTGLKPGDYRFFAWPGTDTVEYRNPLVLQKYSSDSTEIGVNQDSSANPIDLAPIEKEY